MNYPTGEKPRCMGKKSPTGEWYWQPQHPECAGGPDPAFVNEVDGTNTRPKCPWFAQCAAETNAAKLAPYANPNPVRMPQQPQPQPQPPQLPAPANGPMAAVARGVVQGLAQVAAQQQLQQPQMPAPLVLQQPQQVRVQYQQPQVPVRPPQWQPQPQQQQLMQPQQFMQPQHFGQVPMVPPQQAMMPQYVPMNMPAPGMHMMGYLAVPEPMTEGQHWASRLGFSVLRSVFKASGHTVANFFDFNPFGSWPQNGG